MTKKTREALVKAALPYFEEQGWTTSALQSCCTEKKIALSDFHELFPEGVDDIITFIHEDMTQKMLEALEKVDLDALKIKDRVTLAVMTRFKLMAPYRRAFYAGRNDIIQRVSLATKTLFKICDAIWYAIGDDSTDFSYYTKRLSLATIYGATFTYWLSDNSKDFVNTAMFLERRLEDLSIIPKTKNRIKSFFERITRHFMQK